MTEPEHPKRSRGRPPKYAGQGKRQNFNFRITDKMRERLIASVKESGRSLSEEIEFRLGRDFSWEDTKGATDKMFAEASAIRDAAHVAAIRAAGLVILREIEGKPTRVIVDLHTLLAEADGLTRALRSGFFAGNKAPPIERPRQMTAEEEQRLLRELDELRAQLKAATKPDDEVA